MTQNDKPETPIEMVIEKIEHARADLDEAREEEARARAKELHAEHELEEAAKVLKEIEHQRHTYPLIVNRSERSWPREEITGAEIKEIAGSSADWVVNQIVDGPGEDPEILDAQTVHLDKRAEPEGEKRFTTRKPKTSPGA